MDLLQNRSVKKLSKQELIQDYVFNQNFAENLIRSYWNAKDSQSLQEFLCDYLSDESFQECQSLYDYKVCEVLSGVEDLEDDWDEALREELLSEEAIQSYTRMEEINKRSNVKYDLHGFFKIDGVLYYITNKIAFDLTDLPFECVVVSSVYFYLKSEDDTTYVSWENAFDFLLDARFHEELLELLKKEGLTRKNRKLMLFGFREALKNKQKSNRFYNPPDRYNFDIIFAILQFVAGDDSKAHELAQNCVATTCFQGVIDYLSHLLQLEKSGVAYLKLYDV